MTGTTPSGSLGGDAAADEMLRERMELDGVGVIARTIIYRAVRIGGQGGYDAAPGWWDTENFADSVSGAPHAPPFARRGAFAGQAWGLRPAPDWPVQLAA